MAENATFHTVRARSFILTNGRGEDRARIITDENGQTLIEMLNRRGQVRLCLTVGDDESSITILSDGESKQAAGPYLRHPEQSIPRLRLGSWSQKGKRATCQFYPGIELLTTEGLPVFNTSLHGNEMPYLQMMTDPLWTGSADRRRAATLTEEGLIVYNGQTCNSVAHLSDYSLNKERANAELAAYAQARAARKNAAKLAKLQPEKSIIIAT